MVPLLNDGFDEEADDLVSTTEDVSGPSYEAADPQDLVNRKIPSEILARYEVYSYRNAAVILAETRESEFLEILAALKTFTITTDIIRRAGGNETEIPKLFSASLRPNGWYETIIQGDLVVTLRWKEQSGVDKRGRPRFEKRNRQLTRERYLDGHKIDYVKNRVAFDLEWNSKDQTFDRDLYAFSAFSTCGVIDAAVLVTRSEQLNEVFRACGPALKKNGEIELRDDGKPRTTMAKYGASTTWMGKLLYRLNAGRNGACPVLAMGIKPTCVSDWSGA